MTLEAIKSDIEALSNHDFSMLHDWLNGIAEEKKKQRVEQAKAQASHILGEVGLTFDDLASSKTVKPRKARSKTDRLVRYRDPSNPENTWHGGRGRKPKWLENYLKAGRSIDEFAVEPSEQVEASEASE